MPGNGPILILSIDGGGSRGVIPTNVLKYVERLESSEVDFIMELSMMQKRAKSGMDNQLNEPFFDKKRGQHFLDSLYASPRPTASSPQKRSWKFKR